MNIVLTAVYIAVFSWHSTCGCDCNQNNNPVLGGEFQRGNQTYIAASFPNSHSNNSILLAKKEMPTKYIGFFYGAVTGYASYPIPYIAPVVEVGPVMASCLTDSDTTVCALIIKHEF